MLDASKEPWPPRDYLAVIDERTERLKKLRRTPELWTGAKEYYRTRHLQFASHWAMTWDQRNAGTSSPVLMPFTPFKRQRDLLNFIYACLRGGESGLIEKCRDMGATWCCAIASAHLWCFWPGASIGWGSQEANLVDKLGDPDSILEKIRIVLRHLPRELLPVGFSMKEHALHMRIINPETGATIIGDAGDNIGRGGRSLIYFKDEAAHYQHPEMIEAALMTNARTQIDISSVNGIGNVFHRKRENGEEWIPGRPVVKGRTNVLVMDWRDHPGKTQEWYYTLRAKYEGDGLLHKFAQEVDRDYSAAVVGTVIPGDWVRAAIDAHIKLKLKCDGGWCAALDIADGGSDTNALSIRKGILLRELDEWGARDTGETARKAVETCRDKVPCRLQYDAVGMGSSIKAETNRLRDDYLLPKGLVLVPWNAGAAPLHPDRRMIPNDPQSLKNGDFYGNLKAQAWWMLRHRFEMTYRAVNDPDFTWDEDDLISLPSGLPLIWKLVKELSQPTMAKNSRLKLMIDKTPQGTKSPNLADSLVMCYWPVTTGITAISDEVMKRATRTPLSQQRRW